MPGTRAGAYEAFKIAERILDPVSGEIVGHAVGKTGIRFLGDGCYRVVFVDPTYTTVYKVCLKPSRDEASRREYGFFRKHAGKRWCPSVSLYRIEGRPVIAMPFYQGVTKLVSQEASGDLAEARTALRVFLEGKPKADGFTEGLSEPDLHDDNYIITADGQLVVIDGGGD